MCLKQFGQWSLTTCLLLLLNSGCAESNYPVYLDGGMNFSTVDTAAQTDSAAATLDMASNTTEDLYIPPAPVDMAVLDPDEVEFTLRRCVERMLTYLRGNWTEAGCDNYTMEEKSDPSGPYAMLPVAASCMKLECTGQVLEGHNGILARRSCRDIDDIVSVLTRAEADVDTGSCGVPSFQVKILTLDEHMGPEPCDALVCGLEPDGNVIAIDQRN